MGLCWSWMAFTWHVHAENGGRAYVSTSANGVLP